MKNQSFPLQLLVYSLASLASFIACTAQTSISPIPAIDAANHPSLGSQKLVEPAPAKTASVQADYGKLPLSFEANQGQPYPQVKFIARGSGYSLFLTDSAAV